MEDPIYTMWLTQFRGLVAQMRTRGQSRVGLAALEVALREGCAAEHSTAPDVVWDASVQPANPSTPKSNPRGQ